MKIRRSLFIQQTRFDGIPEVNDVYNENDLKFFTHVKIAPHNQIFTCENSSKLQRKCDFFQKNSEKKLKILQINRKFCVEIFNYLQIFGIQNMK